MFSLPLLKALSANVYLTQNRLFTLIFPNIKTRPIIFHVYVNKMLLSGKFSNDDLTSLCNMNECTHESRLEAWGWREEQKNTVSSTKYKEITHFAFTTLFQSWAISWDEKNTKVVKATFLGEYRVLFIDPSKYHAT